MVRKNTFGIRLGLKDNSYCNNLKNQIFHDKHVKKAAATLNNS